MNKDVKKRAMENVKNERVARKPMYVLLYNLTFKREVGIRRKLSLIRGKKRGSKDEKSERRKTCMTAGRNE